MNLFLDAYDRWQGLVPLLLGTYTLLLGYGYLPRKPKDPERMALWQKKFGRLTRILSPFLIIFGVFQLVMATPKSPESIIAEEIQKLNSSPKMVDAITRFDQATKGPGLRLNIYETVTSMRSGDVQPRRWQQFVPQLRRQIANSEIGRLPRKGITVVYYYFGNDGKPIGDVRLTPADALK